MSAIQKCAVCGGAEFTDYNILWHELISEWGLGADEVVYINRQQGHCCALCGNNMRSMALASAVVRSYGFVGTFDQFVETDLAQKLRVLEINEAGGLTPKFSLLPYHKIAKYPEYDLTSLALPTGSYDLVVHSDTLEHIHDPLAGLSECLRVLAIGGRCIFTVPMIVGRLSRSRAGMPSSYHGNANQVSDDYIVHTEFGADVWRYVIEAGFSDVRIYSLEYPAALAIEGRKYF